MDAGKPFDFNRAGRARLRFYVAAQMLSQKGETGNLTVFEEVNIVRCAPGLTTADGMGGPSPIEFAPAREKFPNDGGETILLVEDESLVRDGASEVLKGAGYKVLTAKTAPEAYALYALHGVTVDLLLTDVVLPGESGRMLADQLKSIDPELLVLLMTGYAEQMKICEASDVREDFLAKPFSAEMLLLTVRRVLDRRSLVADDRVSARSDYLTH